MLSSTYSRSALIATYLQCIRRTWSHGSICYHGDLVGVLLGNFLCYKKFSCGIFSIIHTLLLSLLLIYGFNIPIIIIF
ncbi:hypothetical protein Plhal304r1_c034g0107191 [Plasmopara halstedii]